MAVPTKCWKPCIPERLYFKYDLTIHQAALLPFLHTLPRPFTFLFEPLEMRDRVREKDYKRAEATFRKYMNLATALKDKGNKAFERGDRQDAVKFFQEAAEDLEKLLLKVVSEAEEREAEARRLLAICLSNCATARMLAVDGDIDALGAMKDAERAIKGDPSYPKA